MAAGFAARRREVADASGRGDAQASQTWFRKDILMKAGGRLHL
jgi:hypothetical protein